MQDHLLYVQFSFEYLFMRCLRSKMVHQTFSKMVHGTEKVKNHWFTVIKRWKSKI